VALLAGMSPGYSQVKGTLPILLKGKNFDVSVLNSAKILWQYKETKTGKTLDFTNPSF
jgi:hypothetical protein